MRRWRACAAPARRLDRIAAEHPLLAEALAALDRAVIEAGEAEDRLAARGRGADLRSAALDRIETRLFDLRALARKHGCKVDDLPEQMRAMRGQLDAIEGGEAELAGLEAGRADGAGRPIARGPRRCRHRASDAAARLDEAVAGELAPLKLDAARFRTAVDRAARGALGAGRASTASNS